MSAPDLCSEAEITWMVHAFYARVRDDDVLGPIFGAKISDWDHHLARMVDFWSSTLRGTARFSGTPMSKHVALPNLQAATFERWLELFHATTAELENVAMREQANQLAGRIAQSLWYGYQLHQKPDALLSAETLAGARHV